MAIAIIVAIFIIIIAYIILKPYFIKYNTTLLFTGEMGSGKTLNAVKTGVRVYKKNLFTVRFHNWFIKIRNKHRSKYNKRAEKYNQKMNGYVEEGVKNKILKFKKIKPMLEKQPLPRLISNIPIRWKSGKYPRWSNVLTKEMLTFQIDMKGHIQKIPEYSVVIIDEIPQLVNQFTWNEKEVQGNLNELITFFRHYINGLLILTSQNDSQVVKQVRDKMNQFYWLTNFHKFLFFFYKCDICQFIASDVVSNVNTGFVEDNTKTVYGILKKGLYDSRCYSERYTTLPESQFMAWNKSKTNRIIRFDKYNSPLDRSN